MKRQKVSACPTPFLDRLSEAGGLHGFGVEELRLTACELRSETIDIASRWGCRYDASVAAIELAVALHATFDMPDDRLVWGFGPETLPHRILATRQGYVRAEIQGRDSRPSHVSGPRQRRKTSCDPPAGMDSSAAISAALGRAVARDLRAARRHVIAVIGDGALSAGIAYEAMNNAGALGCRLIVVLLDGGGAHSASGDAMGAYLARLRAGDVLPGRERPHGLVAGTLFNELGLDYSGPVDGHSLPDLLATLMKLRDQPALGPALLHVTTRIDAKEHVVSGKGGPPAVRVAAAERRRAVVHTDAARAARTDRDYQADRIDTASAAVGAAASEVPTRPSVLAEGLTRLAARDPSIVAIAAGRSVRAGLDLFARRFPDRMIDAGMAAQHAVTFACGLAAEGMRPFCVLSPTFLQKGYDQVVHDVAIQRLPVRFAIGPMDLVGADDLANRGTSSNLSDLGLLASLPGFVVMAPADEAEFGRMIATAALVDDRPSSIRFPGGEGMIEPGADEPRPLEIGHGRIVREGGRVALLSLGTSLQSALSAADFLVARGLSVTVADARFAKPLDTGLIRRLAGGHELLVTVEDGGGGGFASHVLQFLATAGLLESRLKVRTVTLPRRLAARGAARARQAAAGSDTVRITSLVQAALNDPG